MKAAKMIEDAAKRLLEARPRRVKAPGEQLNEEDINSAILDAARAITDATGSLVKAATVAQRERIAKSRDPTKKHFYRKDPAWANGLISAAQAVGGTTQDLVSSANGFVKKESDCDEDILIAAAKQVAASTARLMAASRAKSDPFSDSHKNLAAASKAVASATQALVDAAKMAGRSLNETEEVELALDDISAVQARKEQLKRQAEMLRLEKELEKARMAYTSLNKDAYTSISSGSSTSSRSSPAAATRTPAATPAELSPDVSSPWFADTSAPPSTPTRAAPASGGFPRPGTAPSRVGSGFSPRPVAIPGPNRALPTPALAPTAAAAVPPLPDRDALPPTPPRNDLPSLPSRDVLPPTALGSPGHGGFRPGPGRGPLPPPGGATRPPPPGGATRPPPRGGFGGRGRGY